MAPASSASGYLARIGPTWGCVYAQVLPASVAVQADTTGGALLRVTGFRGAVDLGGGPITAAAGDTVVGSFSSTGAYRWGKDFQFPAGALVGIDGCGALVVATNTDFDPGCGNIFPPPPMATPWPLTGIARFAP